MSFDIYQAVTDRIIAELEKGFIPWERPWTGTADGAFSGTTKKPYSLLNQMLLGKPGAWFSFQEATRRGGHIRKGEKASFVVFWKKAPTREIDPATGEVSEKLIPVLRYYNVFHIDQIEGLKLEVVEPAEVPEESPAAMSVIGRYIASQRTLYFDNLGVSNRAYYSPVEDKIVVPSIRQFSDSSEYYSTVFHEMTHSTGHSSRLNRLSKTAHFGNEEYSKEELIAEIGAAALCNITGMETPKQFKNSAAYIQGWLSALRNDKKLIVTASGQAAKAVDFILGRPAPEFT